jgi:hypothetical protein
VRVAVVVLVLFAGASARVAYEKALDPEPGAEVARSEKKDRE